MMTSTNYIAFIWAIPQAGTPTYGEDCGTGCSSQGQASRIQLHARENREEDTLGALSDPQVFGLSGVGPITF